MCGDNSERDKLFFVKDRHVDGRVGDMRTSPIGIIHDVHIAFVIPARAESGEAVANDLWATTEKDRHARVLGPQLTVRRSDSYTKVPNVVQQGVEGCTDKRIVPS